MTAQPPHNNRPDNQADWLSKVLDDLVCVPWTTNEGAAAFDKAHKIITTKIAEERLKEVKAFRGVSGDSARAYAIERIKVLEAGLKK